MTKIQHGILGFYEDGGKKVKAQMNKREEQLWANAFADALAKQNREEREANAANAQIKRQMLSGRY